MSIHVFLSFSQAILVLATKYRELYGTWKGEAMAWKVWGLLENLFKTTKYLSG